MGKFWTKSTHEVVCHQDAAAGSWPELQAKDSLNRMKVPLPRWRLILLASGLLSMWASPLSMVAGISLEQVILTRQKLQCLL